MTLKRKLSLAAVLLIVLAVGLIAAFRRPGPPFDVKFIRYQGSNSAVIQVINRREFGLYCSVLGLPPLDYRQISAPTYWLGSFQTKEMSVDFTAADAHGIHVYCEREPSKIQVLVKRVAERIGKESPRLEYWETSVALPPQNPSKSP
jgi:hypothetical protein